jgi:hypothetical protein
MNMMYVFGAMYAVLVGLASGWTFYEASAGPKKDRLRAGIMWGVGIAIIVALVAFGD